MRARRVACKRRVMTRAPRAGWLISAEIFQPASAAATRRSMAIRGNALVVRGVGMVLQEGSKFGFLFADGGGLPQELFGIDSHALVAEVLAVFRVVCSFERHRTVVLFDALHRGTPT